MNPQPNKSTGMGADPAESTSIRSTAPANSIRLAYRTALLGYAPVSRGISRGDLEWQHNAEIWARRVSGSALRRSGSVRWVGGCWRRSGVRSG